MYLFVFFRRFTEMIPGFLTTSRRRQADYKASPAPGLSGGLAGESVAAAESRARTEPAVSEKAENPDSGER